MADLAVVALGIDSSGVQKGEKAAVAALQAVEKAMQQVEKTFSHLNQSINQKGQQAGEGVKKSTAAISSMGAALQGLSGPVGQFSGQIAGVVGQVQAMTSAFGLVGGVTLTAAAGVAALAASFAALAISGSKISDEMLDIAETTNLSLDTVQRFAAGMALAGESPAVIERAFKSYQSAVVEAQDSTTKAAAAFRVIGVDAKAAGQDIVGSFIDSSQHIKEFRGTVAGAEATNIIYGKTAGVIARSQDAVTLALSGSREELQDRLIIATLQAIEAGGKLDTQINKTSNTWTVFKQNMASTTFGGIVETVFQGIENGLIGISNKIKELERNPTWRAIFLGIGRAALNPVSGGFYALSGSGGTPATGTGRSRAGAVRGDVMPPREEKITAGDLGAFIPPKAPKAERGVSLPFSSFTFEQALRALGEGLKLSEERAQGAANGLAAINARMLEILGARAELISKGVPLPLPPSPLQEDLAARLAGRPIPVGPTFRGLPGKLRTEKQAELDEQFSLIFDDMLVSILTAQKTLGEAFGGLAVGIVDTFAIEFTKTLRESFITPVIRGLTDMLQSALKDLFGNLGAGGLKGIFGGIVKGIGTIFGGFFASGGTLGPGKFGIAGERGPELIFAGNQPMHIAPVTAGSAGNVFNISVGVNAPSGTVDKRTQDQLAVTVMNAVKRAQRNEGAR